ncbi:dockerin type I domain-containing protein [Edaphobacter aggregans]|uniref:dockerin type I domain-containing protein n=1 Tax=Edaphobacter aggregans TaxID=570835 RepID=UPI00068B9199|nr:dockerin type I domain-containing protein [Edaphobacter aggregans]
MRGIDTKKLCFFLASLSTAALLTAQTQTPAHLRADGVIQPETFAGTVLQAAPETPDCSHLSFGPHLTQVPDATLGSYVFVFNSHVVPDNDRCSATDRQRLEIKTEGHGNPTPYQDYIVGHLGETVTHRWRFQLPTGFQPSNSFTHIHQIKAFDGDDGSPLITLTPRFGNPNTIQLLLITSTIANPPAQTITLTQAPLAPFIGEWVEAYEKITYNHTLEEGATNPGRYSIVINRLSDNATIFSYSSNNIDMWRVGTTTIRPKWGVYRSLANAQQLRDEQVRFNNICIAKGNDDCPSDSTLPDFSLTSDTATATIAPGGTTSYNLNLAPLNSFTQNVSLSLTGSNVVPGSTAVPAATNLTGLPAAATAQFSSPVVAGGSGSSTLTITTSSSTPPGSYTLVVNGLSADGFRSHVASLPLVVSGAPGDVNHDGTVDCSDVTSVRASFGRKVGQTGYSPAADFNGDGFVNVLDLQFAVQHLPAGTTCQ